MSSPAKKVRPVRGTVPPTEVVPIWPRRGAAHGKVAHVCWLGGSGGWADMRSGRSKVNILRICREVVGGVWWLSSSDEKAAAARVNADSAT